MRRHSLAFDAMVVWSTALLACSGRPDLDGAADEGCGSCHARQADEHASSAHGSSADSPVFGALRPRVEAAWGEAARKRCDGCHTPGHTSDAHVSCVSCHDAIGNAEPRDGKLIIDLDRPPMGPFGGEGGPHGARSGALLADSELCITCHAVTGPEHFVEPTDEEYAAFVSGGGRDSCIDCHMPTLPDGPAASGDGLDRRLRDHTFVGLRPAWGEGAAVQSERASDGARLLERALSLQAEREGDLLHVRLENLGAGHAVPTGVAALRRIWVEVRFFSDGDAVLAAHGDVDADGRIAHAPPIELGVFGENGEGSVDVIVDATEVRAAVLGPGETRDANLPIPAGAIRAVVSIRARAHTRESLDELGLEDRAAEVPTLTAATTEVDLETGEAHPDWRAPSNSP